MQHLMVILNFCLNKLVIESMTLIFIPIQTLTQMFIKYYLDLSKLCEENFFIPQLQHQTKT